MTRLWNMPLHLLTNVTMGLVLLFILYLGFLAFIPVKVMEAQTQPYKIINKELNPGQTIVYEIDICKYKPLGATVSRQIVGDNNEALVSLTPVSTDVPMGCSKSLSATTRVPDGLPPGKYHIELTLTYRVNVLREEHYRVTTESFVVR